MEILEAVARMALFIAMGLAAVWIAAVIIFEAYFNARKRYIEECVTLLIKDTSCGENSKKVPISG